MAAGEYGGVSEPSKNDGTTATARYPNDEGANNEDEKTPLLVVSPEANGFVKSNENDGKGDLWSCLVFGWLTPLLQYGHAKNQLDQSDLDQVKFPIDCRTSSVTEIFEQKWQEELERNDKESSLVRALWRSYSAEFLRAGSLKLANDVLQFVGPAVLNAMIYYLRDVEAPPSRGLYLTAIVAVSQLTMSLCVRHYFFMCYKTGLRVRTAVVLAVYKKALMLSSGERQTRTVGEITNLMSIDAKRLQDLCTYLHAIWYSMIQIILAFAFLWQQLGTSCLAGISVMIVIMPVTKVVAQGIAHRQQGLMNARDARVNINSEVLSSMKIVKIQGWEEPFQKRILDHRAKELKELLRYWIYSSATAMIWNGTPLAVALATFAAYIWTGHNLEVASALTSLALFDILRFPLFMLPQVINSIAEAMVSINRVQSFLLCEEHRPIGAGGNFKEGQVGVQMKNVSAAYESKKMRPDETALKNNPAAKELADKDWEVQLLRARLEAAEKEIKELTTDKGNQEDAGSGVLEKNKTDASYDAEEELQRVNLLCLKRLNFHCQKGELIAVVGAVGAGKSSFINAILGEVRQLAGTLSVSGSLSYFAQSPFVLGSSIKDNILFGHADETFDAARYKRALDVCALKHDLDLLPYGDMTEVGEKGITLSGGQRARVALARAVYHNADISLIDDALSAVDAHVAKHLFDNCIIDELLETNKKSVVLVTNAIQFLNHKRVTQIVVLNDGHIVEQGSYTELMSKKGSLFGKFVAVIKETGIGPGDLDSSDVRTASVETMEKSLEVAAKRLSLKKARSSVNLEKEIDPSKAKSDIELMPEETRSVGHVKLDVYMAYARAAGGVWVPFLITTLFASVEFVNVFLKWFLTYWSSHGDESNQGSFLCVYALANLASILASFLCFVCVVAFGLKASNKLFIELLDVVLRAPMSFFDTTPLGRIVNRFSKDMYTVDEELVMTLRSYLMTLMTVVSTIVVISGVTPVFTFCLIPIIIFYGMQQQFFTVTYRELKRIDSVNRSPLFALLGESIDGVATIRAFSAQDALIRRLTKSLDTQQHAYYLTFTSLCWLAVRCEMIGTTIVFFACLCSVYEHDNVNGDEVLAGLYGLSISYALNITGALSWSVRMASDFEANMVAVERVKDYCLIPSEADHHTPNDKIVEDEQWPSSGQITFAGVKLKYRPTLPLVLKGLDIIIPASSKVGVVGRTGAGKSTLMTSLLRLVELDSGEILIDGLDIRTLGLTKLRKAIAVIPQDPILFSGSIRVNLDPFSQYTDETLERVLDRVGLLKAGRCIPTNQTEYSNGKIASQSLGHLEGLDNVVTEGGSNFSVGQRQLLVIARALLRGASIVILDEATGAVDAGTDAFIQSVLHSEFVSATTITIAHRLNTIIQSDFILVMDNGRAAEFDRPKELLAKGGMFRDLVEAATLE